MPLRMLAFSGYRAEIQQDELRHLRLYREMTHQFHDASRVQNNKDLRGIMIMQQKYCFKGMNSISSRPFFLL